MSLGNHLDTTFLIITAAIIVLLMASAFFSGSETALTAASRAKLRAQADRGEKGARAALQVTRDRERLIGAVLFGNNLLNILAAALATALFTRVFGDSGVALATLAMTFLVLIFAEVLPKTYAITNAERAAARVARPIAFFIVLFSPVVSAVRWLVRQLLRLCGVDTDPHSRILSVHDEIAGALALGRSEGVIEKEQRDRLMGALDLSERSVNEVMLHRSEIEMIDVDLPPGKVLERCLASPHTRLPIYRREPENIVGVIHAKDLLRAVYAHRAAGAETNQALAGFSLLDVAKAPYFIPETTALDDQMHQFLKRHMHFALVVDEYGALQGLITLEDILEEIVGEITDEFDTLDEHTLERVKDGSIVVDAAMTIRDFNRAMDWSLPDDEANTIAGLVIHEAQMIPTVGQVFSFHGFRFEVLGRQENRITRLRIKPL